MPELPIVFSLDHSDTEDNALTPRPPLIHMPDSITSTTSIATMVPPSESSATGTASPPLNTVPQIEPERPGTPSSPLSALTPSPPPSPVSKAESGRRSGRLSGANGLERTLVSKSTRKTQLRESSSSPVPIPAGAFDFPTLPALDMMAAHPGIVPQNSATKNSTPHSGSLPKAPKPYTGLGTAPRRPSGSFETNTSSSTSTPASTRARKMSAHTPTAESQHAALASASKLSGMFDSLLVPVHTGNTPPGSPQMTGQPTRRARSMSQGASSRPGTPGPGNETPGRKAFIAEAMNTSRAKTPVPAASEKDVEKDVKTPAIGRTPVPARSKTPIPARSKTPVPARTKTPVPAKAKTPTPARSKAPVPTRAKTPVAARPKTPGVADGNVFVSLNTGAPSDEAPITSAPGMASTIKPGEPKDQPMASPPNAEVGPQLDEVVTGAAQLIAGPSKAKTVNGTKKSLVQSTLAFGAPAANKTPGMRRMTRSASQKIVPPGPLVATTAGGQSNGKALGPGKSKEKDDRVPAASAKTSGDDAMVVDEVVPSNAGTSSTFLYMNIRSSRCRLFRLTADIHTRQDLSKGATTTF
jgi:hypothetical protein